MYKRQALHRALDDSVLTGQVLQKVYDPASFAEQMAVVDDAFYDRITFKNVCLLYTSRCV